MNVFCFMIRDDGKIPHAVTIKTERLAVVTSRKHRWAAVAYAFKPSRRAIVMIRSYDYIKLVIVCVYCQVSVDVDYKRYLKLYFEIEILKLYFKVFEIVLHYQKKTYA